MLSGLHLAAGEILVTARLPRATGPSRQLMFRDGPLVVQIYLPRVVWCRSSLLWCSAPGRNAVETNARVKRDERKGDEHHFIQSNGAEQSTGEPGKPLHVLLGVPGEPSNIPGRPAPPIGKATPTFPERFANPALPIFAKLHRDLPALTCLFGLAARRRRPSRKVGWFPRHPKENVQRFPGFPC